MKITIHKKEKEIEMFENKEGNELFSLFSSE